MKSTIQNRILALRHFMQRHHLSAFIIPSSDPHSGEYVPAYWESRKWISGFTGSAGTIVITMSQAGLWTDSRYFLQAEEELSGTEILLFKDGHPDTPRISQWLCQQLPPHSKIGIHGAVNSWKSVALLKTEITHKDLQVISTEDPFTTIWPDRPGLPEGKPFILSETYTGESCIEKIHRIRLAVQQHLCDSILISALDEIAWSLNMRGNDVHCTPVFVSYLLITPDQVELFILPEKLTEDVQTYLLNNHIIIRSYHELNNALAALPHSRFLVPASTNYELYSTLSAHHTIIQSESPVLELKAIKNSTEIAGFHAAMRRDGVAMVKFIKWLKENVGAHPLTEYHINRPLFQFRAAQDYFQGESFDTIAGYQANGAIVHYTASPHSAATLKPEGLLLLDSGAQYLDGTTDLTRTIVLGPVTEEQRTDYTLVLKGFIALSMIEFPHGTCGTQLDVLARQFLWRQGMNYGHGTGHGVGHFLSVHEGPHQIRMNHVAPLLLPGMTVTNEPGLYKNGAYGIRIENTMLVTESRQTEFGKFYKFESLTLCPIDTEILQLELLTKEEVSWLNHYHQSVYEVLSPLLPAEEKEWLQKATSPIILTH